MVCPGLSRAEAGAHSGSTDRQLMLCSPNSSSIPNVHLEPKSHQGGHCWEEGTQQAGPTESGWGSQWPMCALGQLEAVAVLSGRG